MIFGLVLDTLRDGAVADPSNVRLRQDLKFFGIEVDSSAAFDLDAVRSLQVAVQQSPLGLLVAEFVNETEKSFLTACRDEAGKGKKRITVKYKNDYGSKMLCFGNECWHGKKWGTKFEAIQVNGGMETFMEHLAELLKEKFGFQILGRHMYPLEFEVKWSKFDDLFND